MWQRVWHVTQNVRKYENTGLERSSAHQRQRCWCLLYISCMCFFSPLFSFYLTNESFRLLTMTTTASTGEKVQRNGHDESPRDVNIFHVSWYVFFFFFSFFHSILLTKALDYLQWQRWHQQEGKGKDMGMMMIPDVLVSQTSYSRASSYTCSRLRDLRDVGHHTWIWFCSFPAIFRTGACWVAPVGGAFQKDTIEYQFCQVLFQILNGLPVNESVRTHINSIFNYMLHILQHESHDNEENGVTTSTGGKVQGLGNGHDDSPRDVHYWHYYYMPLNYLQSYLYLWLWSHWSHICCPSQCHMHL